MGGSRSENLGSWRLIGAIVVAAAWLLAACEVTPGDGGSEGVGAPDSAEILGTSEVSEREAEGPDAFDETIDERIDETIDESEAPEPYDPDCHWDCFGHNECHDGVVTTWAHVPVPCEYYDGECPHEVSYTCERGCRTDTDTVYEPYYLDPKEMCEEGRPKHAGDPCAVAADCEPQVAEVDGQGHVTNVYLRCDEATGTCVAREPPVVEDWLAPCGIAAPLGSSEGYEYGFVTTDACSGGVCLINEEETCVRQGCTIRCDTDDDCPPGSTCQRDYPDWTESLGAWTTSTWADVCKPGQPNNTSVGLSCP